jgi:hypothetical protein
MNRDLFLRGAADVLGVFAETCLGLAPALRNMQRALQQGDGKVLTAPRKRPAPPPTSEPSDVDMARADLALRRHGIGL